MEARQITIVNRLGLHARAAAKLVKLASGFSARVTLEKGGKQADAKSIMSVMMLAATCGSTVSLHAEGDDAEAAMDAIQALIDDRFEEAE